MLEGGSCCHRSHLGGPHDAGSSASIPLPAVALILLAGAGGACGGDAEVVVRPSDIGHVHDVVVDGDAVLVATHRDSAARRARWASGGRGQIHDLMSMTKLDGGGLIASGHPDLRLEEHRVEGAPPFLGLITSSEGGTTWEAIGLRGEADFHALDVAGEIILGGDSAGAIWRLDPPGGGSRSALSRSTSTTSQSHPTTPQSSSRPHGMVSSH